MSSNGYNTLAGRATNGMTNLNISRLNTMTAIANVMNCNIMSTTTMYIADTTMGFASITNAYIQGDLRVAGDISATGNFYVNSTIVTVTDQFTISNTGTGPALQVYQIGAQDIATFYDDTTPVLRVLDGGMTSATMLRGDHIHATSITAINLSATSSYFSTISTTSNITVNGNTFLGPSLQTRNNIGSILMHQFAYSVTSDMQYYTDYDIRQISTVILRLANHSTLSYLNFLQTNQVGHVQINNQLSTPRIYTPNISISTQASIATLYNQTANIVTCNLSNTQTRYLGINTTPVVGGVTMRCNGTASFSNGGGVYPGYSPVNIGKSLDNIYTGSDITDGNRDLMIYNGANTTNKNYNAMTFQIFGNGSSNRVINDIISGREDTGAKGFYAFSSRANNVDYTMNTLGYIGTSCAYLNPANGWVGLNTNTKPPGAAIALGSQASPSLGNTCIFGDLSCAGLVRANNIGIGTTPDANNAIRILGHTAMGTNVAYTSLASGGRVLDLCYGPLVSYTVNGNVTDMARLATFINADGNDSNANRHTTITMKVTGYSGDVTDLCIGDISFVRENNNQPAGAYYFKTRTNNTALFEYRDIMKIGYNSMFISPINNGNIVIGSQSPASPGYNICIGTPYGSTQTLEIGCISTVVRGSMIVENSLSVSGLLSSSQIITSFISSSKLISPFISATNVVCSNLSAVEIVTPYIIASDISIVGSLSVGSLYSDTTNLGNYVRHVATANQTSTYIPSSFPDVCYMYHSINPWPTGYNWVVLNIPFTFSLSVFNAWVNAGAQINVTITMQQKDTTNNGVYTAAISYSVRWLTNAYYTQYYAIQNSADDAMPGVFNCQIQAVAIRQRAGYNPNGFAVIFEPGVTFNSSYYYMMQAKASIICPGYDISGPPTWSVLNSLADYVSYYIP